MIWVILFVLLILWFVFSGKNNSENGNQAYVEEIVEKNIALVEKGVEIYNDLITLIEKNTEFKNFGFSRYPHFVIRERCIMIAMLITASSDSLHYYEEVYNKIQENEKELCNYSIENISDCEELCSWLITDDSIKDYESEYAVVRMIGMLRKIDDGEYILDGGTVVEQILKRI